ncbi:testican-3-like [Brienomyrus brachyistius]|uniref:testican-3-like n=1 Tax=Brienomyrus brachyistius TaxID=42636 RepID=UPI0020B28209|nr:testican-3-like [Brienomyrus brachyistius]
MAESHNEPLIPNPGEQTIISMRDPERDSNRKAFKVAGFTVLACLLVAGQALTAYFVLSQKSKLGDIEQSNESLRKQLLHQTGGSSGTKMINVPIHSMPAMVYDLKPDSDKGPSPIPMTGFKCKNGSSKLPGFQPVCDEEGNYRPMQCWKGSCWCVDSNGTEIPNSYRPGRAQCGEVQGLRDVRDTYSMEELSDQ